MCAQTWASLLIIYPPLTVHKHREGFSFASLCKPLCSLVFHHSPVFSLQQRFPDGIKARIPVSKSSHCLSLQHFSGGSLLKSTVTDGGWWICSQEGGGVRGIAGVISPSIHLTIFPCRLLPQLRIITHDASPLPL